MHPPWEIRRGQQAIDQPVSPFGGGVGQERNSFRGCRHPAGQVESDPPEKLGVVGLVGQLAACGRLDQPVDFNVQGFTTTCR